MEKKEINFNDFEEKVYGLSDELEEILDDFVWDIDRAKNKEKLRLAITRLDSNLKDFKEFYEKIKTIP